MTEVLDPKPTDKVYEVGTGSGYQAAILSRLVKDVYSVEIHAPLGKRAAEVLKEVGYTNIHTRDRRRLRGLARGGAVRRDHRHLRPEKIPQPLVEQLKEGGRMVIPLGDRFNQIVHLMIKKDGKLTDQRAQADPVRADDRPGPARGRRGQGSQGEAVMSSRTTRTRSWIRSDLAATVVASLAVVGAGARLLAGRTCGRGPSRQDD